MSSRSSWSDSPKSETDITGRRQFAAAVASRIAETPPGADSTVFGLVGPWGGGKTTLLLDIEGRLEWDVVWFSPWSAADAATITAEFIAALAEAYPQAPSLKSRLLAYARLGAPALKAIPVVGDAAEGVATGILGLQGRPAWHTEFQEITNDIMAENRRVLIIVDDVDRLSSGELRALLRVIRLLGRFKNVHYLIAYDQATIDHLLATQSMEGHDSGFMEKIVQYPFEVPPPPRITRRRWARDVLSSLLSTEDQQAEGMRGAADEVIGLLEVGLQTPRAAERLREQLTSLASLARDAELDPIDYVIISWLRISQHAVWDHIRINEERYRSWRESDEVATVKSREADVRTLVQRGSADSVWKAVTLLFGESTPYFSTGDRKRRMREARYFDRYFLLGLADDDISDARTQIAVDCVIAGNRDAPTVSEFTALVLDGDAERAALALQVGQRSRRNQDASLDLIEYLETRRQDLETLGQLDDFRRGPLERWLGLEISFALASGDLETNSAVDRFGWAFLASAATALRRRVREENWAITETAAFGRVADLWITKFREKTIDQLAGMTQFDLVGMCYLAERLKPGSTEDLLAAKIQEVPDILRIAELFVTYNRIYGGVGAEWDVAFITDVFERLTRSALNDEFYDSLPLPSDTLDYEITDRSDRELRPTEVRDFILRNLWNLRGAAHSNREDNA
jgi:hypothetical protein